GAVGAPGGLGQMMGGPVVLEHGTEEQQDAWVPRLAAGLESWCQLFSEPGAGSDLASLSTRAVRDGDVWIVNGQKVWTSGAVTAGSCGTPISSWLEASRQRAGERAAAMTAGSVSSVMDLAREFDRVREPVLRNRVMSMYALSEAHRFSALRMRAAAAKGKMP